MRDFLKSSGRRLRTGWFWPLALLTLPNCLLDSGAYGIEPEFEQGPMPTSAVMCDIPKVESKQCATADEAEGGISMTYAAIALVQGEESPYALDFSPEALNECNGLPMKREFHGPFPTGYAACLNCETQIDEVYADRKAVCVAQCQDLINFGEGPVPAEGAAAWCEAEVSLSTNFAPDICYDNACDGSGSGALLDAFVDPRRTPYPVSWEDRVGTIAEGSTLEREAEQTGQNTEHFDAGAASSQVITHGDGWVEFEAGEIDLKSHVVGLTTSAAFNATPPTLIDDIHFAISLNKDGNQYVIESGNLQTGPGINGSFGAYAAGERYRVVFKDNHDGTATISYWRVVGPCAPGTVCTTEFIADQTGSPLSYPFRVGAAFREQFATVVNVTLVRIQ